MRSPFGTMNYSLNYYIRLTNFLNNNKGLLNGYQHINFKPIFRSLAAYFNINSIVFLSQTKLFFRWHKRKQQHNNEHLMRRHRSNRRPVWKEHDLYN